MSNPNGTTVNGRDKVGVARKLLYQDQHVGGTYLMLLHDGVGSTYKL
jgi:hypothetical protein